MDDSLTANCLFIQFKGESTINSIDSALFITVQTHFEKDFVHCVFNATQNGNKRYT